jgi:hypothetical protein
MKEILCFWLIPSESDNPDNLEFVISGKCKFNIDFDENLMVYSQEPLISRWPENVTINVDGSVPVDFLVITPSLSVVSDRVKVMIEQIAGGEVEFLPIKIHIVGCNPITELMYWAIHILNVVDALNWEHTRWTVTPPPMRNDPMATLRIIKPCFRLNKIQSINIFRFEVSNIIKPSIYISKKLKEALENESYTVGMNFTPVKTV